jgi:hypothetical protein
MRKGSAIIRGGVRRTVTSLSVMAKQSLIVGEMTNDLLPTPVTDPSSANGHARNLAEELRGVLMPTPTVGDSRSGRNSTAKRKSTPPSGLHKGDTLTDAVTLLTEDQ